MNPEEQKIQKQKFSDLNVKFNSVHFPKCFNENKFNIYIIFAELRKI